MPTDRPRSRTRSVLRVAALAAIGAVAFGGASAATAFALDAQQGAPAADVRPLATAATSAAAPASGGATRAPATRKATTVSGWAAAPGTVRAGATYRVLVRVTGADRAVRLERRVGGAWKAVDQDRASRHGAAALAWKAPRTATRTALRVHVLGSDAYRATATAARTVAVRATAKPASPKPATSTSSAPVTAAPATSAAETLRAQLLVLVNRARSTARSCGGTAYPAVAPLARSAALDRAAGDYALKMGTERFFAHESPDGSTMVSRLKAVGIGNTAMRENIAAGQTSAAAVMDGWLRSPGHCANIMAKDVTRIGLGHATVDGSPYRQYWVQDFAG